MQAAMFQLFSNRRNTRLACALRKNYPNEGLLRLARSTDSREMSGCPSRLVYNFPHAAQRAGIGKTALIQLRGDPKTARGDPSLVLQ